VFWPQATTLRDESTVGAWVFASVVASVVAMAGAEADTEAAVETLGSGCVAPLIAGWVAPAAEQAPLANRSPPIRVAPAILVTLWDRPIM
jgi:hypothetical protein